MNPKDIIAAQVALQETGIYKRLGELEQKQQTLYKPRGIRTINGVGPDDRGDIEIVSNGSGTVTSISVVTANGVSGSVSNPTTTPAVTLSLGAITPTSVNSIVLSGSSTPTLAVTGTTTVSGSNTGDQDLSGFVPITRQVNGHALSADVTVTKGDISLGNVDNTSDATKNSATVTLTNKRITKRTGTTTSSVTPTINTDNVDFYSLTAQSADITSFTTNLSGTPTEGQTLWIAITGTAARAITWGTSFESSTVTLPTTTVTTNRLDVGFVWNTVTTKWRCIATA